MGFAPFAPAHSLSATSGLQSHAALKVYPKASELLLLKKIASTDISFVRSQESKINWNARLICIRGSRGTGKTFMTITTPVLMKQ